MHAIRTFGLGAARWLLTAVLACPAFALANDQPLFADHSTLDITLTGPWSKLAADSAAAPEWRSATLRLAGGEEFTVNAAPRGKSRRRKDFCGFPPLRLDFKRAEVANSVFAGQNKLKLVTHCGRLDVRGTDYSDRLHSEYLLYRILNRIDQRSFAVRAVRITYVDSNRNKSYTHPGFFIEHKKHLAKRLNATILEQPQVPVADLNGSYAAVAALFAYFAGNTDFAFTRGPAGDNCCHNAVPLRAGEKVIAIPYDFDSTGFVKPPYAAPAAQLGLKRVTQRLHRGYCAHSDQLPLAIATFTDAKTDISELIDGQTELSAKRKKRLQSYTERFYKILSDPVASDRRLLETCR